MISVSGDSPAERESEKTGETQVLFKKSHRSILMKINKKSRGVRTRKKKKMAGNKRRYFSRADKSLRIAPN